MSTTDTVLGTGVEFSLGNLPERNATAVGRTQTMAWHGVVKHVKFCPNVGLKKFSSRKAIGQYLSKMLKILSAKLRRDQAPHFRVEGPIGVSLE